MDGPKRDLEVKGKSAGGGREAYVGKTRRMKSRNEKLNDTPPCFILHLSPSSRPTIRSAARRNFFYLPQPQAHCLAVPSKHGILRLGRSWGWCVGEFTRCSASNTRVVTTLQQYHECV